MALLKAIGRVAVCDLKNMLSRLSMRCYSVPLKGEALNLELDAPDYLSLYGLHSPHDTEPLQAEHKFGRSISTQRPAYKAVVFDKDGTLICFNSVWVPWAKQLALNISDSVKLDVQKDIFTVLGICSRTARIQPGLLAEGTKSQICEAITEILSNKNIPKSYAYDISEHHVNNCEIQPQNVNQLDDLQKLFAVLQQHDVRIAICTSDSRAPTIQSLNKLGVLHLVDLIVCGDDKGTQPKPNAHNGHLICDKLNVKPNEVVMVGDTPTDVEFAKNSEFGLALGVLSGVGQRNDLERAWYGSIRTEHDVSQSENPKFKILPSVAHIIPFVLPNTPVPVQSRQRHFTTDQGTSEQQYKLIILDKNGSLTDVHPRWSNWAEELSSRLQELTSPEIGDNFMKMIGYDSELRRVSGGMLPECSVLHIRDFLSYLLTLNGYNLKETAKLIEKVWFVPDFEEKNLVSGAVETITKIHLDGVKIAVNTSDSHESCKKFMSSTGLEGKIDYVLSAEDTDQHPKPLPHTVHRIMKELGHQPKETIIVGDTSGLELRSNSRCWDDS